jgi:hypothetical protein
VSASRFLFLNMKANMASSIRLANTIRSLSGLALLLVELAAFAHGSGPGHALPDASVTGIERGVDLAMNCDHAIHELIFEYDYCMRANHDLIGPDPAAETAFRFMAWLRAAGAVFQGYPDALPYRYEFRRNFLLAQARHPLPAARLCQAIGIDCATLPEPVPQAENEMAAGTREMHPR